MSLSIIFAGGVFASVMFTHEVIFCHISENLRNGGHFLVIYILLMCFIPRFSGKCDDSQENFPHFKISAKFRELHVFQFFT